MTYTGDVVSGGPSEQRDLPQLTIRKVSVGAMANNVYLLTCARTGAQLLIDAARRSENGSCPCSARAVTAWTSS